MRAAFPDAPEEADNEVCEDGTACHWLASEIWHGNYPMLGSLSPNLRILTDEMFDGVDVYHGVLRSWANVEAVCEQYVPIPRILTGFGGTPDAWAYDPTTKTLYVADLKFGFRFVEVWFNWQLICYVVGLLDLLGLWDQDINVVCTIVQPRNYHRDGQVRSWRFRSHEIRPLVFTLVAAAARAMQPQAPCTPNPGCYDCAGRHACMAYQNSTALALEVSQNAIPLELTPEALGKELSVLKDAARKIEGRITGLTTQAEHLMRNGKHVPGWSMVGTFAREGWRKDSEVQLLTLAEKYFNNVSITKPPTLVTPAQARKILPSAVVAVYAHKPSTGVKLTKQDPLEATKAFGAIA